jgi:hypothetical protein
VIILRHRHVQPRVHVQTDLESARHWVLL